MRSTTIAATLLPVLGSGVQGIRILQGNDDGWAEVQARVLHYNLVDAGHNVVLSMPAENKSGSASKDEEPTDREEACEYDSCPAGSGPQGSNATDPNLNWVNSYPVTAWRYGLDTAADLWDGAEPDLAVAGPNTGSNLVVQLPFSGTVGVASYAVDTAKIPAIAFSVVDGTSAAWDTVPVPADATLYGKLASDFVDVIADAGAPYLPDGVFLNVNYPSNSGNCTTPEAFSYVLSRIYPGTISPPDTQTCGDDRLPNEAEVVFADGCFASVSVGDASDKTDMNDAGKQEEVAEKLKSILTCLP